MTAEATPVIDRPDLFRSPRRRLMVVPDLPTSPSVSEEASGLLVDGKPPGYLSEGDLTILKRYSKGYKEPPMGFHDRSTCPGCR